jgi:hypothetical protein
MKYKALNVSSIVKKQALPNTNKMYNVVKTTEDMTHKEKNNLNDFQTQVHNFTNKPSTNVIGDLKSRYPSSSTFKSIKGNDYGLGKELVKSNTGHFSLNNNIKSSTFLNNKVPKTSTFKMSNGIPTLNKGIFGTLQPKNMDYRYVDPQTYEYKLKGLTQQQLIKNKMREEGETDKTLLDPTSEFLKWREEDLNNKAAKIQGLFRGAETRENVYGGLASLNEINKRQEEQEKPPLDLPMSDIIKIEKAKRAKSREERANQRKHEEIVAKESKAEEDERELYFENKERKKKEQEQLIKNRKHLYTPKQRVMSQLNSMSKNIDPNATTKEIREQGKKILEDQEKIIGQKGAKELREQGSKINNFIVNKVQKQRDAKFIKNYRQEKAYEKEAAAEEERREAFYKLPRKEQDRLRDAEAKQRKKEDEEEDKRQKHFAEKQQIKQASKYQNLPKKERESIRLMQLGKTNHNIVDKTDLVEMQSRLKNVKKEKEKEKDDAKEVELQKVEKQIEMSLSPPKTRSRSRGIDAEKAEKVLKSREAQVSKGMSKKYKDVEGEIMTQSDDEEEPMKVVQEKDLTEIQKKTLVKEENKLHSNILEESDRISTLAAVLHQLESTNLINSSQKMSKQLKDIVMPAYAKLNIQKVHGNRDINSVYKELTKNLETSKYKKESMEEALKDLPRKIKSKGGTTLNTSTMTPNHKRQRMTPNPKRSKL